MPRRALSIAVKFPVFVLALLLVVISGLASYFNIALKRDLERLLSAQQFSAVSVIAASIEQETRLRLQALDELAQTIGKRHLIGSSEQLDQFLRGNLTITALFNGGLLVLGSDGIRSLTPCNRLAPRIRALPIATISSPRWSDGNRSSVRYGWARSLADPWSPSPRPSSMPMARSRECWPA